MALNHKAKIYLGQTKSQCETRADVLKRQIVIPGHAGGQGYEPPQPPDPIVVTYKLYVVDPPPALKIRGVRVTYGHNFFHRGGEEFFSFVHGSKMAICYVMFFSDIYWVKMG